MNAQQLNAKVRAIIDDPTTSGQHLADLLNIWSIMPPTWFQLENLNLALSSYLLAIYDPSAYAYLFNLLEKASKLSRQSVHVCQVYVDRLRTAGLDVEMSVDLVAYQVLFLITCRLRPFIRVSDSEWFPEALCERLALIRRRSPLIKVIFDRLVPLLQVKPLVTSRVLLWSFASDLTSNEAKSFYEMFCKLYKRIYACNDSIQQLMVMFLDSLPAREPWKSPASFAYLGLLHESEKNSSMSRLLFGSGAGGSFIELLAAAESESCWQQNNCDETFLLIAGLLTLEVSTSYYVRAFAALRNRVFGQLSILLTVPPIFQLTEATVRQRMDSPNWKLIPGITQFYSGLINSSAELTSVSQHFKQSALRNFPYRSAASIPDEFVVEFLRIATKAQIFFVSLNIDQFTGNLAPLAVDILILNGIPSTTQTIAKLMHDVEIVAGRNAVEQWLDEMLDRSEGVAADCERLMLELISCYRPVFTPLLFYQPTGERWGRVLALCGALTISTSSAKHKTLALITQILSCFVFAVEAGMARTVRRLPSILLEETIQLADGLQSEALSFVSSKERGDILNSIRQDLCSLAQFNIAYDCCFIDKVLPDEIPRAALFYRDILSAAESTGEDRGSSKLALIVHPVISMMIQYGILGDRERLLELQAAVERDVFQRVKDNSLWVAIDDAITPVNGSSIVGAAELYAWYFLMRSRYGGGQIKGMTAKL